MIFIERVALAMQGDNAVGSVHSSLIVCLSICMSGCLFVKALLFWRQVWGKEWQGWVMELGVICLCLIIAPRHQRVNIEKIIFCLKIPVTLGTYCIVGYRHLFNGRCPTSFVYLSVIRSLRRIMSRMQSISLIVFNNKSKDNANDKTNI